MHIECHSILHRLHRRHIITVTNIIVEIIVVHIVGGIIIHCFLLFAFCYRFDFVSNSTTYPSGKIHGTAPPPKTSNFVNS